MEGNPEGSGEDTQLHGKEVLESEGGKERANESKLVQPSSVHPVIRR